MNTPDAPAIVAEVRAEMARKGCTASTIARATDMAQPTISRKLSGQRDFTLEELLQVCAVLETPLATLIERAETVAA